ncbi:glycosyltransferase family 2 protein [Streptacidiphilus carbonis]|uniref:glycosyltransferase family 2 protein n=1 Tax=Streptacidiphilus carbonis TaxID=105422 RepID=UPI0005AB7EF5|nr:glycosyltransferase family 2 protein [Streptacidiphilus carbonis]
MHHPNVSVSVVICAYTEDRWESAAAAVESVLLQSHRPLEVLLVVDHNPALLRRLTERHSGSDAVSVLANAEGPGLSGGRNTGVRAARGEVVAFLDDDAVAEPDWLRWFADGYADAEVMGVGGLTLPVWASGRRPGWYPEEFDWVHGATYRGMPTGRARVRNVLGGNASFRRSAMLSTGGFDAAIGRGADSGAGGARRPLGGEETELCIRIQQADPGAVFLFDDRSVIHHQVPCSRETFGYFRSRCWAEGLSKALVAGSVGAVDGLATERRYVTRTLPSGIGRGLGRAARGDLGGLGCAAAITVGGLVTAGGYALGTLRRRRPR